MIVAIVSASPLSDLKFLHAKTIPTMRLHEKRQRNPMRPQRKSVDI